MSIVKELQISALSNTNLSELLRKALFVARKLNISEFSEWILKELNGYSENDAIPEYRKVTGELQGLNPLYGWQPVTNLTKEVYDFFSQIPMIQPISVIDELAKSSSANLRIVIPHTIKLDFLKAVQFSHDLSLSAPKTIVTNICDKVRTILLDWALKLEEQGILGEGASFTAEEKNIAEKNSSISIGNFYGTLGDINHSQVNQEFTISIKQNNLDDVRGLLTKYNLDVADIDDLIEALKTDPHPQSSKAFGQKVSDWFGMMLKKAASGVWDITTKAATELLTKVICSYYGFH